MNFEFFKTLWIIGITFDSFSNLNFKSFKRSVLFIYNLLCAELANNNIWRTRLAVHLQTDVFVLYKRKKLRNRLAFINFLQELWLSFLAVSVDFCTLQLTSPAFHLWLNKIEYYYYTQFPYYFQYKFRLILFTVSIFYVILWL